MPRSAKLLLVPVDHADPMTKRNRLATILFAALVVACGSGSDPLMPTGNAGPEGGRLEFLSGRVVVDVPAGALTESVELTVEPVANAPGSPRLVAGTAYDLGPDGLQFAQPVTLTIAYEDSDLPFGVRGEELRLYKALGQGWQER